MNLDKRRCKLCNSLNYIKIFKNKAENRQQGLYCSSCGKYQKFLTNKEVYYYVGIGLKLVNTFGDLSNTPLRQLNNSLRKDVKSNLDML